MPAQILLVEIQAQINVSCARLGQGDDAITGIDNKDGFDIPCITRVLRHFSGCMFLVAGSELLAQGRQEGKNKDDKAL